jgi:hypothetical protein
MTWTKTYWDTVHHFYWVPQYFGLTSIPKEKITKTETTVTIPREFTNPTGPLYRRTISGKEYWSYIRRQEETFNHIWNITLGITPGDVAAEIFNPLAGWNLATSYAALSGTIGERYPVLSGPNVTTPDCLLISDEALLAIEIKFNAKTSLDQIAKYLSVLVAEEQLNGIRAKLGILFVYPSDGRRRFQRETGKAPELLNEAAYDDILSGTSHPTIKRYMGENRSAFESALNRLTISCVTWSDISARLTNYIETLGDEKGDRTLTRLLSGLALEIQQHPLSRCNNSEPA